MKDVKIRVISRGRDTAEIVEGSCFHGVTRHLKRVAGQWTYGLRGWTDKGYALQIHPYPFRVPELQ